MLKNYGSDYSPWVAPYFTGSPFQVNRSKEDKITSVFLLHAVQMQYSPDLTWYLSCTVCHIKKSLPYSSFGIFPLNAIDRILYQLCKVFTTIYQPKNYNLPSHPFNDKENFMTLYWVKSCSPQVGKEIWEVCSSFLTLFVFNGF